MKLITKETGVAVALVLGVIMLFLPATDISKYRFDPEKLSSLILDGEDRIPPETVSEWIIEGRKDYMLIDIRSESEFNEGNIKTSENIPIKELLKKEKIDELLDEEKTVILYSNGNSHSYEAWMILKNAGVDAYVMQGGMNYWNRVILNPEKPSDEASDDELLVYKSKAAVAGYFGGGSGVQSDSGKTVKKKIKFKKKRKKKKKKLEGC